MKVFLCLLLCVAACAARTFNCNQDSPKECETGSEFDDDKKYPETAEEVDARCGYVLDAIDCQLDFSDQCPNTLTAAFREANKSYRNLVAKVCDKNSSLRQMYLEKVACLNKNLETIQDECTESEKADEYCKKEFGILKCTVDSLTKECGSDGKELFDEIFKHQYDIRRVFCR